MGKGRDRQKHDRREFNTWANPNQKKPYDKNKRHKQKNDLNDIAHSANIDDVIEAFDAIDNPEQEDR